MFQVSRGQVHLNRGSQAPSFAHAIWATRDSTEIRRLREERRSRQGMHCYSATHGQPRYPLAALAMKVWTWKNFIDLNHFRQPEQPTHHQHRRRRADKSHASAHTSTTQAVDADQDCQQTLHCLRGIAYATALQAGLDP